MVAHISLAARRADHTVSATSWHSLVDADGRGRVHRHSTWVSWYQGNADQAITSSSTAARCSVKPWSLETNQGARPSVKGPSILDASIESSRRRGGCAPRFPVHHPDEGRGFYRSNQRQGVGGICSVDQSTLQSFEHGRSKPSKYNIINGGRAGTSGFGRALRDFSNVET